MPQFLNRALLIFVLGLFAMGNSAGSCRPKPKLVVGCQSDAECAQGFVCTIATGQCTEDLAGQDQDELVEDEGDTDTETDIETDIETDTDTDSDTDTETDTEADTDTESDSETDEGDGEEEEESTDEESEISLSTPNDPLFPYQWHLNNDAETQSTPNWRTGNGVTDIDWLEAHSTYGSGQAKVIVVVEDTGVQLDHPGLQDSLWTCPADGNPCPADGLPDSQGQAQCVPGESQCTPGAHGVFAGAYCAGDLYGGPYGNSYCTGGWAWGIHEADGAIYDKGGHGTNVAGIIAGVDDGIGVTGICHNCEIMVAKALNMDSLNHIIRNAAIEGKRVVFNDSTPASSWNESTYGPLFERIESENVVYTTSAGNSLSELHCDDIEESARPFCCLDATVCVSAIVEDGKLLSSYGDAVDVSGTGYIMTTRPCTEGLGYCTSEEVDAELYGCETPGGLYGSYPSHNVDDDVDGNVVWWGDYDGQEDTYAEGFEACYNRFGGTSSAAPVVAGVAAEILSHFPDVPNDVLKSLLKQSATSHTIFDNSGRTYDDANHTYSGKLGAGLVNLNNALNYLYTHSGDWSGLN